MASTYQSNNSCNQVVVVMIPLPAQGHLNQLLHLSRLILSHNIPVHYVCTTTHIHQALLRVQGWDPKSISNFHFHDFEVPHFASPTPNPNYAETKFPSHLLPSFEAALHLRKPVASLLHSLSTKSRRIIVIHDSLMASVAQDATHITNAENYTFNSVSVFTLLLFRLSEMEISDVKKFHLSEAPSLEGCFTEQFMNFARPQGRFNKLSDGNIYNTTRVVEGPYMELVERLDSGKMHWALGPFNPLSIEKKCPEGKHFIIEWLDKQEPNSVIYVSFGSTTTLEEEQIREIANGLEQSKQRFIWVLRDADKGNIFNDGEEVRRNVLPNGFEESLEGLGLVIRDWAPQLEILSHPSTGGFMSHCGWNSSMESISMGVPIAAWPMHSDQPGNTVLITQVLKVGLVVKDWAQRDELVTASVIESAARRLMETKEGDEMRQKALNMRDAILRSIDEGGVSCSEMDSFIAHISR